MRRSDTRHTSWALSFAALAVVFGDIGTSPLYALREAFSGTHGVAPTPEHVFGVLSFVIWALVMVVSVKYLSFVMRADNKGEGGILSLTALAAFSRGRGPKIPRRYLVYLGLFGAALIFGDAVLTPAVSVLGALEGLKVADAASSHAVVPLAILIIIPLFLGQRYRAGNISRYFGAIIFIWFLAIAATGVSGILQSPDILWALDPLYMFRFVHEMGWSILKPFGAIVLVVTGAETLYADMGRFGVAPIKRAWFWIVFPCLALNYLGQGALLLREPTDAVNPFYKLCPDWALVPMILLATMAAMIASRAIIAGVFSITQQAIQLGYCPRLKIIHKSEQRGRIYIPQLCWGLLILTIWVVLEFQTSSALAGAYGLALAATMTITTILACTTASTSWQWNPLAVASLIIIFLPLDLGFLSAKLLALKQGAWFPLVVGIAVNTMMTTWKRGRQVLMMKLKEQSIPFQTFLKKIQAVKPSRVRGAAIFMTGDPQGTPYALLHNLKHNKVLHEQVGLVTFTTEDVPRIKKEERVDIESLGDGFYRITAYYGFMESPNIIDILDATSEKGIHFALNKTTFFLGRETLLATPNPTMSVWREALFSIMSRNAERATTFFSIPPDQVVEIGIQIKM